MPKDKKPKDLLEEWYKKNRKNHLSAVRYRIFALFVTLFSPLVLFQLFRSVFGSFLSGIFFDISVIAYTAVLTYILLRHFYRNLMQLSLESDVLHTLNRVRKNIRKLEGKSDEKEFRSFQINLNRTRKNLKDFIEMSTVLTPPIANYELDRLQKAIDIFFNTTSEALFPIKHVFSRAQKLEQEQILDYYYQTGEPTDEEIEEHHEDEERERFGTINYFDLDALDEFLKYLGDILFSPTNPYSPFSYKHPINLISLSQFFNRWNKVISTCRNCIPIYSKAVKDVEKYYSELQTKETQRRQRFGELTDKIVIVVISVGISTIINYLLQ